MKTNNILNEVGKVIVGKDDIIKKILAAILAGGHILLEDVPGVGKTTMARSFSKALGLESRRIQFTSDTMPSDVTGFSIYSKEAGRFIFQPGPVMTDLLLADEINRTSSKTQAALLEVMEEKQVTADGKTYPISDPFIVIATQNPTGSAGTQPLPVSQLDRFIIKLSMGYPDISSQIALLKDRHTADPLDAVRAVTDKQTLINMQNEAAAVYIDDSVYDYIARLAEATRTNESCELGLSPRGALAICRYAKAFAYMNGRNYVLPQDVKEIFADTAAHRLILTRKARIAGADNISVAANIAESVSMPAPIPQERTRS